MSWRFHRPAVRLRLLASTPIHVIVWMVALAVAGHCWASESRLTQQATFHIAKQPLDTALIEFSKQAGVPVSVAATSLDRIQAPPLSGTMEASTALKKLLDQSGLYYEELGGTVTVLQTIPVSSHSTVQIGGPSDEPQAAPYTATQSTSVAESKTFEGNEFPAQSTAHAKQLEEVIVTAQKRSETLQDVPVPVTAISAETLIERNQSSLLDYYSTVPALDIQPRGPSSINLTIRGIGPGDFTNPTVGITIDDVPFGASTSGGGGLLIPDIDPSDLARIEVLRGPQGTLYGASSMGGLVKYVTVDPSTEAVGGRVEGGASSVYNGAEPGYSLRGSINVPVTDDFAIRAGAFTRQDPGFIDNPALHISGINEDRVNGGRLSGLWRPTDTVSLKLSALYQDAKANGINDIFRLPGFADLQQNYPAGVGVSDRKVQAYSATLSWKAGSAEITSLTGYNVNRINDEWDFTYFFLPGGVVSPAPYPFAYPTPENIKTDKFTQELRLSTPIGQHLQLLVGAFYTHEHTHFNQYFVVTDPVTAALLSHSQWFLDNNGTYKEYALFANATYHLTDRIDVQIGGRESHIDQSLQNIKGLEGGPGGPVSPLEYPPSVGPNVGSSANAFTYLFTPEFKISPHVMTYIRLASGYRAGGSNAGNTGTPPEYSPDKTQNYEVGFKGDVLDGKLFVDASLYYIDWSHIQVLLINPATFLSYAANGNGAKSQGVELSVESRPLSGLTVAAWVTWDDAVLTQAFPPNSSAYGVPGERLPYTSRFSGHFSLDQTWHLINSMSGFIGGSVSYVGDREGIFTSPPPAVPPRQVFPAYAQTDVRVGLKNSTWTATVYATNITNKRGLLSGGIGEYPAFGYRVITPRTIGLSLVTSF